MKKKSSRLQLNIRLTPEQNELIKPFEDVPVVSVETKDENTEKLLQEIQQGCDEFWQLLKSLKQEKQKQV